MYTGYDDNEELQRLDDGDYSVLAATDATEINLINRTKALAQQLEDGSSTGFFLTNFIEDIGNRWDFQKAKGELSDLLEDKQKLYRRARELEDAAEAPEDFASAAREYLQLQEFRDSASRAQSCSDTAILKRNEAAYRLAREHEDKAKTREEFLAAAREFEQLGDFKDSEAKMEACQLRAAQIEKEEKASTRRLFIGTILLFGAAVGLCALMGGFSEDSNSEPEEDETDSALFGWAIFRSIGSLFRSLRWLRRIK